MSGSVTRLFERGRARIWRPAPDGESVPQPRLSLREQLDEQVPRIGYPRDADASAPPDDPKAIGVPGSATHAANQRQRLRHANELLRTFTKTA